MDGADDDIDLVALDELTRVFGGLGGVGLIVDGHVFDRAAAHLAAKFIDMLLEAVGNGMPETGVGSRVRQHETDLELAVLRR